MKEQDKVSESVKRATQRVGTKNASWGFYGTLNDQLLTAGETNEAAEYTATAAFAKAAAELVQKGLFSNDQEAGNFLDSAFGRHIADQIGSNGSVGNYSNLAGAVKEYKKRNP